MWGSQPVGSRSSATLSVPPAFGAASPGGGADPRRHRNATRTPSVRTRMSLGPPSRGVRSADLEARGRRSVGERIGTPRAASRPSGRRPATSPTAPTAGAGPRCYTRRRRTRRGTIDRPGAEPPRLSEAREFPRHRRGGPAAMTSRAVLGALAAGALLRLALLNIPRAWHDEATTGLMGLAVLRGQFPVYFFGQPFMGALDAYLAAPIYLVLGTSFVTLKLLPVLLSIVWAALAARLAWDLGGARAAWWTAVLLAVPPDFLLYWTIQARTHYPLGLVLGTLGLLLARRAGSAPWPARRHPVRAPRLRARARLLDQLPRPRVLPGGRPARRSRRRSEARPGGPPGHSRLRPRESPALAVRSAPRHRDPVRGAGHLARRRGLASPRVRAGSRGPS